MPRIYTTRDIAERFQDYVSKGVGKNACWLFTGGPSDPKAYGNFYFDPARRVVKAHKVAWFLAKGKWPHKGLVVCHNCNVKRCVRPAHLREDTQINNLRQMQEQCRNNQPCGEAKPATKLTEVKVRKIRKLYKSGDYSYQSLAQHFGVGPSTVEAVITRRSWRHI